MTTSAVNGRSIPADLARRLHALAGVMVLGGLAVQAAELRSSAAVEPLIVQVADFGAKGDGQVDDSPAFNAAIQTVAQGRGGIVRVPTGLYLIPGTEGHRILPKSNVTLSFAVGAQLVVGTPAHAHYPIDITSGDGPLRNVVVENAVLTGDPGNPNISAAVRVNSVGTNTLDGVVLRNLRIRDFSWDGIYINGASNNPPVAVTLENLVVSRNRRHGLALICVDGFTARDCTFEENRGFYYSCGVDAEPNWNQRVRRASFVGCTFAHNRNKGLWFNLGKGLGMEMVSATDCRAHDNGDTGLQINNGQGVSLNGIRASNNATNGTVLVNPVDARIEDNQTTNNLETGLYVIAPERLEINRCDSVGNRSHGLLLTLGRPLDTAASTVMIRHSNFSRNGRTGVFNGGVPRAQMLNNRFESNGGDGLCLGSGANSNLIASNEFLSNGLSLETEGNQVRLARGASYNQIVSNHFADDLPFQRVKVVSVVGDTLKVTPESGGILPPVAGRWLSEVGQSSTDARYQIKGYARQARILQLTPTSNPPQAGTVMEIGGLVHPRRPIRLERGASHNRLEANNLAQDASSVLDLGSANEVIPEVK